ncbi:Gx transporter family protein [uncultured Anaerococcus sp.]|uniref:Gx transporter family protein n=1 Tax=uncultured Anaerococcus sp. TaxID=293428 RepID=UPI00288A2DD8|nr:Gx transporter family protein [uncultured Anaerococcus sp.]
MNIKKLTNMALLLALALVISVVELQIPMPVPIPGAKLGLSNIIILVSLYFYGFKASLTISLLKSFMLVLITGAVSSFFYSAVGAILSTIAMVIALKFHDKLFSFIGVSEIGAFAHNLGQIIVSVIVMENIKMFYYLPLLVFVGTFSGFFVGLSSNFIIKHMKKLDVGEKLK